MKFKDTFGIIGDMIGEVERVRFRTGESRNKPYGGNIADNPFSKTLYRLVASKGFESQKSLAQALGSRQSLVNVWYRGMSIPSPELFGRLLVVLDLTDEKKEPLVELYAQKLANKEIERKSADSSLKISRRKMRPSDNPMGKWSEDVCREIGLTLHQGSERLESPRLLLRRRKFSLKDLDFIQKNAKDAFDLSEDELAILVETIGKEKQYRIENGRRFQSGLNGRRVIEEQKKLNYPTFNGEQARVRFGRSRERIRQVGQELGISSPYADSSMEKFRAYFEEVDARRGKHEPRRAA